MIKFEHTKVMNFDGAVRGMRNPMNSWDKSDSKWRNGHRTYNIGENDLELMQKLIKAGSEHRKFMRQIFVSVDITAPLFWWKEFDTYKVGTVRNSCSTMHKIHIKEFTYDDFSHEGIDEVGGVIKYSFQDYIDDLEYLREKFNETKEKKYWRALIEMLPDGFNMKATITMDYENLLGMCSKGQRRNHKLSEWSGIDYPQEDSFIQWARKLPYAQELIFIDEVVDKQE